MRALAAGALREAIVYLWGEPGSGRTHLLRAAARANPALVIADDVETLDAAGAAARCSSPSTPRATARPPVLAAGRPPPARPRAARGPAHPPRLGPGLPAEAPERRGQGRSTCAPQAARRGLRLPDEVVGYLLTRLPRDLPSLNAVLDALDRYSLAAKRPVTLPLVREALERKTLNPWLGRHKVNPHCAPCTTASTSVTAGE